ncbi:MAG TPA: arsenate reductase ArsC [Polyangiaceae bacterium]|jgi:arsenate reductase|nr:arsenate reductase ArsC [Polyangiaceae bacterium]
MRVVVFACVHSAGRSQMAAAWFNRLADPAKARAVAAGTQPAEHVHPVVVEAMKEAGIDLSAARPQLLTSQVLSEASHLITMGCGEQCPVAPPGVRRSDWELEDPKGGPIERVRPIRDEIERRVATFVRENGLAAVR